MLIDLPTTGESLTAIGRALPMGTSRHIIADGVKGTAQTIKMMQDLVNAGKRDNDIRKLCGKILNPKDGSRPCRPKDYFCYAKALYSWVRDNILYAYDPHNVEYLEKASITLSNGIGDCDSQDILLCSMFEHVGLQAQFVTIKADPSRSDEYTHVYTRVLIPKVGWIVADPIMPEKWFGWEPPYPSGKHYWAASTDELDQTLDTTDSVPFPQPSDGPPADNPFDGVIGMGGLGSMGRGGHGRGGRRWGGGADWGGPSYWGGGFDDNIVVMPVGIPVPSQIIVVETQDVMPQELQSPMQEESFGLQGMGGVLDVFSDAADSVKATLGIKPPISDETKKFWVTRIVDGTEAANLNSAKNKANDAANVANKAIATARLLPDSNPSKSRMLQAAYKVRDAVSTLQYSINDAMGKYNEIVGFIGGLTRDAYNIPKLSGLGVIPAAAIAVIVASVSISWAVYQYSQMASKVSDNVTALEQSKIDLAKTNPQAFAAYNATTPTQNGGPPATSSNWFDKYSGEVVKSALTLGAIGLAFYAAAKVIGYGASVADSKIKQTLKVV